MAERASTILDPNIGMIVTCIGKKRSGKSVAATVLAMSYPGDVMVIDVAGDDGPEGPGVVELRGPVDELPSKWPESKRDHDDQGRPLPMVIRYVPDAGSPTYLDDMDAVVGLAYNHGHCCLLVHEMGRLAVANRTPPNTLRVLQHNRHVNLTAIFAMPRPLTVDPLVIAQSDLVFVFETPNPHDRRRVAETAGIDPATFDHGVHGLGRHEYLLFDANKVKPDDGQADDRVLHFPPLPAENVAAAQRWAHRPDNV